MSKSKRAVPDLPITLLSRSEVAAALGVSEFTISDWTRKGILPAPSVRINAAVHKWRLRDIERWMGELERRSYVPPSLQGRVKAQLLAQHIYEEEPPRLKRERVRLDDPETAYEPDVTMSPKSSA
jgi:hypothetical protein